MAKTPRLPSFKIPVLKTNTVSSVMRGLTSGLISELTSAKKVNNWVNKNTEKKPIDAGRGGKYYSENRSHYSRF